MSNDSVSAKHPSLFEEMACESSARAKRLSSALHILTAFLVSLAVAFRFREMASDSDMWWILATGREIVENGIMYTNPFSDVEGMSIVVQQWLYDVIEYLVYSCGGVEGLCVLAVAQATAVFFLMYLLARSLGASGLHMIATVLICAVLCLPYAITLRPAPTTMILLLVTLLSLSRYRKTKRVVLLLVPPIATVLAANLQASMVILIPAVVLCCSMGTVGSRPLGGLGAQEKKSDASQLMMAMKGLSRELCLWLPKAVPYVICAIVCLLASLANPYGIDGALYVVKSYGVASGTLLDGTCVIQELKAWSLNEFIALAIIVITVMSVLSCYVSGNSGNGISVGYAAMYIVMLIMALQHVRCCWFLGILGMPLVCRPGCVDFPGLFSRHNSKGFGGLFVAARVGFCIAVFVFLAALFCMPSMSKNLEVTANQDDGLSPVKAVEYMDSAGSHGTTVYTSFDSGGFLEYQGFKVALDTRPELWSEGICCIEGMDRFADYRILRDTETSYGDKCKILEAVDEDWLLLDDASVRAGCDDIAVSLGFSQVVDGEGYILYNRNGDNR